MMYGYPDLATYDVWLSKFVYILSMIIDHGTTSYLAAVQKYLWSGPDLPMMYGYPDLATYDVCLSKFVYILSMIIVPLQTFEMMNYLFFERLFVCINIHTSDACPYSEHF